MMGEFVQEVRKKGRRKVSVGDPLNRRVLNVLKHDEVRYYLGEASAIG
jgi:hypothetical protein